MLRSFSDVVALWGDAALARDIGAPMLRVRKWRHRNRIPSDSWGAVVRAAEARAKTDEKFKQITLEVLADLSEKKLVTAA